MNYINKMYGSKASTPIADAAKNPNRVMGGLRAQGVDSYKILGEDGMEKEIPTQRYVRSLEEKIQTQRTQLEQLQKQVNRLSRNYDSVENYIKSRKD